MTISQTVPQSGAAGRSEGSLALALALVFAGGAIISLYAMMVHLLLPRSSAERRVQEAAMLCAQRLATISVDDPEFGPVGLVDATVDGKQIRSLNSIYATLHVDYAIARKLGLKRMADLVELDCPHAKRLEEKLTAALVEAVNQDKSLPPRNERSLNGLAWSRLIRMSDKELVFLSIHLGNTRAQCASGIKAAAETNRALVDASGSYKAMCALPVDDRNAVCLYQLAPRLTVVPESEFVPQSPLVAPSAVLVEATYALRSGARSESLKVSKTSACVLIGGAGQSAAATCLLLSFPHGVPGELKNLGELLLQQRDSLGDWLQAQGGSVPGSGRLAQNNAVVQSEKTTPAAQTAFYHFLRAQGPAINAEQVRRLLSLPVPRETQDEAELSSILINSGLLKDTGSRRFSLLHQSGPGEQAQQSLRVAFAGLPVGDNLPPSAVPLQISTSLGCHLPGRNNFARQLIERFLNDLRRTNMAAKESAAIASLVDERMTQAIKQTNNETYMLEEELYSVSNRMQQAAVNGKPFQAGELAELRDSQTALAALVKELKEKSDKYERIRQRARIVITNAHDAQRTTYEICARMQSFAHDGIFATQTPTGYLLSMKTLLVPQTQPVTEAMLYAPDDSKAAHEGWLSVGFAVARPAPSDIKIENARRADFEKHRFYENPIPQYFLVDGMQLQANGPVSFVCLKQTPFADTGVDEGELLFYSPAAFTWGTNPAVTWSMLIRDQSYQLKRRQQPTLFQLPAIFSVPGWGGAQMRLGVEMQVRAPLPLVPDLAVGSYLESPDGMDRATQVPPVPPGMI